MWNQLYITWSAIACELLENFKITWYQHDNFQSDLFTFLTYKIQVFWIF